MIPTSDLVAIPPVVRTVIYYLIAEAIIVCGAVTAGNAGWDLAGVIAQGNAVLFFGTAAAKVSGKRAKKKAAPEPKAGPDGAPEQV